MKSIKHFKVLFFGRVIQFYIRNNPFSSSSSDCSLDPWHTLTPSPLNPYLTLNTSQMCLNFLRHLLRNSDASDSDADFAKFTKRENVPFCGSIFWIKIQHKFCYSILYKVWDAGQLWSNSSSSDRGLYKHTHVFRTCEFVSHSYFCKDKSVSITENQLYNKILNFNFL